MHGIKVISRMPPVASASVLHATAAGREAGGRQRGRVGVLLGKAVEKMLLLRVNIIKIHQSLPKTCEKLRFLGEAERGRV